MIHYFFVRLGYETGIWLHIPAALRIPFSALIILICSWAVVALVKRLMGRWATILMG